MGKNEVKYFLFVGVFGLITIGIMAPFQSCKKWPAVPSVTTAVVTDITHSDAVSGGNVTNDKGAEVISKGICWAAIRNPVIMYPSKTDEGPGAGPFTSTLTDLTPNTTFYVRAYATNSEGTSYGNEVSFKTSPPGLASATTFDFSAIATTSAWSGGLVTSDGGVHVYRTGVCWSTSQNPTTADNKTRDGIVYSLGTDNKEYLFGDYDSYITGLIPNTTYYVRSYAINMVGTGYGDQKSFKTLLTESPPIFNPDLTYELVTDIDGNTYKSIQIGTQTWMAQNLKTTKFSDGTPIQNITNNLAWHGLTTPAYCWYENNKEIYGENYGAMYNWYAVGSTTNGGKNICPNGWHVPTQDEISTLIIFLGGEEVAGGKLKETGITHWWSPSWKSPDDDATNSSGFTALPAGYRYPEPTFRPDTVFVGMNSGTTFWSSSVYTDEPNYSYALSSINAAQRTARFSWFDWGWGLSVRCIKDSAP